MKSGKALLLAALLMFLLGCVSVRNPEAESPQPDGGALLDAQPAEPENVSPQQVFLPENNSLPEAPLAGDGLDEGGGVGIDLTKGSGAGEGSEPPALPEN